MLKSRDMHTNYTLVIQFKGNKSNSGREKKSENSKKCFHSKHHSKKKCHIIFKEERNYLKIIFLIAVILITTANGHVCRTFSSVIIIFSKPFVFLKS